MSCLSRCQLTLNKIQLFQRRDMSWELMFFFSGRKLGQYADRKLLKSLFQNKTPDLSLKYIYSSKCMTSRVSSENKGKQAKRKNSVKKQRPNRRNGTTRKQKTKFDNFYIKCQSCVLKFRPHSHFVHFQNWPPKIKPIIVPPPPPPCWRRNKRSVP